MSTAVQISRRRQTSGFMCRWYRLKVTFRADSFLAGVKQIEVCLASLGSQLKRHVQ